MAVNASSVTAGAGALQVRQNKERFTAQDFVAWVAPWTNGVPPAAPAALTGVYTADALASPWVGLGWLSDTDGLAGSRNTTVVNQTVYGSRAPLRTIVTAEVETFKFTPTGTANLPVIDLWAGNAPGTTATPSSGAPITFTTGSGLYPLFSLVLDGFDGASNQLRIYVPAAQVTDPGDENWKESDDITRPLTVTALYSSTISGATRREIFPKSA